MKEVARRRSGLYYEELHNVYASTNVVRKKKAKRTKMVDI
jgi:hypothetical protein